MHYLSGGDKEEVFESYKMNLSAIPCKIFNFGQGECPFRNSCMYEHRLRNGQEFEYGWMENFVDDQGDFH
jgi:E3 ubiquitin-protein ligase makorin